MTGAEVFIPLNKLKKHQNNARKTQHGEASIEAKAASIHAKGILQNLVVEPELDADGAATGFYLVSIGEGRRLAQLLRVKASDFLSVFGQQHAFRIDTSAVTDDVALETAAAMTDWITDLNDVWDDCAMSQRLEYARSFVELCSDMERHGFICHMWNPQAAASPKGQANPGLHSGFDDHSTQRGFRR